MVEVLSAIITGGFALAAAIWSKRASNSAKQAHLETQSNGGNNVPIEEWGTNALGPSGLRASMADKIDQLGRRLITMDERSERTERKVDQLSETQDALSQSVQQLEKQKANE